LPATTSLPVFEAPPRELWLRSAPFPPDEAAASAPKVPGNSGFWTPKLPDDEAPPTILAVPDEEISRVVSADTLNGEVAMPAASTGRIAAPASTARIRDLSLS